MIRDKASPEQQFHLISTTRHLYVHVYITYINTGETKITNHIAWLFQSSVFPYYVEIG